MDAPKSPSTRLASLSIETSDVEQDIKDTDALVWEAAPRQRLDSGVVLSPSTTFPAHLFPKSTEDAIPALSTPLIVFVDTDLPTDPALAFPPELFLHVLAFLGSPAALAPCCLVSKTWKKAAEDSLIWSELVKWLWECKAYVPARWVAGRFIVRTILDGLQTHRFKELLAQGKAKDAYKLSLHDSKRDVITKDGLSLALLLLRSTATHKTSLPELCSFDWEWRFKADAGNHFTDEDPWWNNEKPRIRQFHPSGKMGGSFARPDITWRFVVSLSRMVCSMVC